MNIKGKQITVMGLGIHGGGEGLVRYLSENGANIIVTDLKDESQLKKTINNLKDLRNIKYHLGGHKWSDFKNADIVFLNPVVPKNSLWVKKIIQAKIPISSEMNLFFEKCLGKIIGVTGTNGKSTTVNIIYEILKNKFEPISSLEKSNETALSDKRKVFLGGNIGGSLLHFLDKITQNDVVVLELSSFQLYDLSSIKISPHISIILNITPDHLDAHTDFKEYIEAKKNIIKFQENSDFAILNYDSEIVRKLSKGILSKVMYFSTQQILSSGAYIGDGDIFINFRGKKNKIMQTSDIKLLGSHNLENILAAITVGNLYNIKPQEMKNTISEFTGLAHRIEFVNETKGVKYYNDSKSTTPESTIAALKCFKKPVILIAGGKEKGFDFSKLAKIINKKVKYLFLIGETAPKIEKDVLRQKNSEENSSLIEIFNLKTIEESLNKVKNIAKKSDIVLLSPATSSFDQFASFEERGERFKKIVEDL